MNTCWRKLQNPQPVKYKNKEHAKRVYDRLRRCPPLVTAAETDELKKRLADAALGKCFVLQGGHCAETFRDFDTNIIMSTFETLVEGSRMIADSKKLNVVCVGRMAGQYGKPRSKLIDGDIVAYRGDNINGYNKDEREYDPDRLMKGYLYSAATMNFVRTLKDTNFFINNGFDDFYVSHEAMHLEYEHSFVRKDSHSGKMYLCSTHLPWIGERTRSLEGAHVAFCKDISNPIGLKIGPTADPDEVCRLVQELNPLDERGKIVLVARMGRDIHNLADIISKCRKLNVTWISDPMHGNTYTLPDGRKTRNVNDILKEVRMFCLICHESGVIPAGIHLEMTGEDVTECVDENIWELSNYTSLCDPRLNRQQSLRILSEL